MVQRLIKQFTVGTLAIKLNVKTYLMLTQNLNPELMLFLKTEKSFCKQTVWKDFLSPKATMFRLEKSYKGKPFTINACSIWDRRHTIAKITVRKVWIFLYENYRVKELLLTVCFFLGKHRNKLLCTDSICCISTWITNSRKNSKCLLKIQISAQVKTSCPKLKLLGDQHWEHPTNAFFTVFSRQKITRPETKENRSMWWILYLMSCHEKKEKLESFHCVVLDFFSKRRE